MWWIGQMKEFKRHDSFFFSARNKWWFDSVMNSLAEQIKYSQSCNSIMIAVRETDKRGLAPGAQNVCCCSFWVSVFEVIRVPLDHRGFCWTTLKAVHYIHLIKKKGKTKQLICAFIAEDKHAFSVRIVRLLGMTVSYLGLYVLNTILLSWSTLIKGVKILLDAVERIGEMAIKPLSYQGLHRKIYH